jgi:hypothetical protein
VRVERVDFPLTLILSPEGERRYLLGFFSKQFYPKIFEISHIIPSPFDGGG